MYDLVMIDNNRLLDNVTDAIRNYQRRRFYMNNVSIGYLLMKYKLNFKFLNNDVVMKQARKSINCNVPLKRCVKQTCIHHRPLLCVIVTLPFG